MGLIYPDLKKMGGCWTRWWSETTQEEEEVNDQLTLAGVNVSTASRLACMSKPINRRRSEWDPKMSVESLMRNPRNLPLADIHQEAIESCPSRGRLIHTPPLFDRQQQLERPDDPQCQSLCDIAHAPCSHNCQFRKSECSAQ